ncbi:MAG: ribosome maturation factor RimP [Pseudohongiellaceae bacterium]|jgi:ribosome maturation factor RimP
MATRAELIRGMVEPVLNAMGLQLWGVEYLGQGKHTLLRIYIEKEGGINVEDCAEASRQISGILDVEDPISSEYTLEVSSPGVDRMLFTLDQYRQYAGWMAKLRLTENFEGRRNFQGRLGIVEGDEVVLLVGEDKLVFPIEMIEKANIVAERA